MGSGFAGRSGTEAEAGAGAGAAAAGPRLMSRVRNLVRASGSCLRSSPISILQKRVGSPVGDSAEGERLVHPLAGGQPARRVARRDDRPIGKCSVVQLRRHQLPAANALRLLGRRRLRGQVADVLLVAVAIVGHGSILRIHVRGTASRPVAGAPLMSAQPPGGIGHRRRVVETGAPPTEPCYRVGLAELFRCTKWKSWRLTLPPRTCSACCSSVAFVVSWIGRSFRLLVWLSRLVIGRSSEIE